LGSERVTELAMEKAKQLELETGNGCESSWSWRRGRRRSWARRG
jgi:hypothetical protein